MAKYCVFFIALPLPVIVYPVCFFDNFEKLSMSFGFSRDVLEGWARDFLRTRISSIKNNTVIISGVLVYLGAVYIINMN